MQVKNLLNNEVYDTACSIVRKVVKDLIEKIETDVRKSLIGKIQKMQFGGRPSMRTINFKRTITKNLKNYDKENNRLIIEKIHCNTREKRNNPWNVVIAVDQSGSMVNSVIYSAVMASIFWKLPMITSKLIAFDSNIVDLSKDIDDPVKTLMSVQLGGGTDIANALSYCYSLIENPKRTIMILISDLYEGNYYASMYRSVQAFLDAGCKLIVLPALDYDSVPDYDKKAAKTLVSLGADVGVVTPNKLADWIADIIK